MKYFCPFCWSLLDGPPQRCPACMRDLQSYDRLSYEDKLIGALQHPVREHRMIAVETLGRLRSERALGHFSRLLEEDADPYLLREVVQALADIGTPAARDLLGRAAHHRFRTVRQLASRISGVDPAGRT
jgi:hypothetical protein